MQNSRYYTLLVLSVLLIQIIGCSTVEETGGCSFVNDVEQMTLVWSDEFDDVVIDESKWSYDLGDGCHLSADLCGWGNNELQYYTARPENVFIEDGHLVIQSIKENPLFNGTHNYTSARLTTKQKGDWKFGRIDVRAKMPLGQGIWPAIWMLPTENVYGTWPKSGEIDITEYLGHAPKDVFGTIHYGHDNWQYSSQGYSLESSGFNEDFHVFSVLWTEDCIQFLVDDNPVGVPNTRSSVLPKTWPFDQDFHLLLNTAVGGNLPGNPDGSTVFPQQFKIDYVRIYQ